MPPRIILLRKQTQLQMDPMHNHHLALAQITPAQGFRPLGVDPSQPEIPRQIRAACEALYEMLAFTNALPDGREQYMEIGRNDLEARHWRMRHSALPPGPRDSANDLERPNCPWCGHLEPAVVLVLPRSVAEFMQSGATALGLLEAEQHQSAPECTQTEEEVEEAYPPFGSNW